MLGQASGETGCVARCITEKDVFRERKFDEFSNGGNYVRFHSFSRVALIKRGSVWMIAWGNIRVKLTRYAGQVN